MAATQEIQWETGTNPPEQSPSRFPSLHNYAFSNPFRGDPTTPKKSIWEKSTLGSVTFTSDKAIGDEETTEHVPRRSRRKRIILGIVAILVLVLIIGLAAGLTRKGYVNLTRLHRSLLVPKSLSRGWQWLCPASRG